MKIRNSILIIGPLPGKNSRSIGGATLLMKTIIDELNKTGFEYDFIPLRKCWVRLGQIFDFPILGLILLFKGWRYRVVAIHASWDFLFIAAPFIIPILKCYRTRLNIHAFGGHLHKRYNRLPSFYKWWLDITVFSCDLLNFETKEMVHFFKDVKKKNTVWFPNCRRSVKDKLEEKVYKKKFVFISRVIRYKGIYEILDVFKELGDHLSVDFYGPISDYDFLLQINNVENICYKGIVDPANVINVLQEYDVLLLPTYYPGEGYPGIIIEGFSIGIPVITTKWNSIPEIVDDGYNGLLIEPANSECLRKAVLSINQANFDLMRSHAFESFNQFAIDKVIPEWLNDIEQLL